jgi:hypothetical protein
MFLRLTISVIAVAAITSTTAYVQNASNGEFWEPPR